MTEYGRRTARGIAWTALATVAVACGGGRGEPGPGSANDDGGSPTQSVPPSILSGAATEVQLPTPEIPITEIGFNSGSPDAPIKVLEFSDFGCGYCRRFHAETFPALVEQYIETGKVEWKYVTFVSGMFPNGTAAALAAECAGEQERFPPMRELLYERSPIGEPVEHRPPSKPWPWRRGRRGGVPRMRGRGAPPAADPQRLPDRCADRCARHAHLPGQRNAPGGSSTHRDVGRHLHRRRSGGRCREGRRPTGLLLARRSSMTTSKSSS